ncbi:IS3 family transposase [Lihuaxuella thermophila]|uniref:IS3 family transposase n=1 Tax=Lihuaxuella thermophila TaxID=1173111 RepID=UPI00111334C7
MYCSHSLNFLNDLALFIILSPCENAPDNTDITLGITPIRPSYRHPQSNGKWYRTLKEEEIWLNEYRTLEEARASIEQYIHFYNHERLILR